MLFRSTACIIYLLLAQILPIFLSDLRGGNILFSDENRIFEKGGLKISENVWGRVLPYLMPNDHPIREQLDSFFSSSRVIFNMKTLRKAGFIAADPRRFTDVIIASHPLFPGYIFKLFIDVQRYHDDKPEYEYWIKRAEGARLVQAEIDANGWSHLIKTPKKLIYPLPRDPSPPSDFLRKNFILVEENMDILSNKENDAMWKSSAVTFDLLHAFFLILKNVGLVDCAKTENVPFSIDGRIAFIDTQTFHRKVYFREFLQYLSPENRLYWKELMHSE